LEIAREYLERGWQPIPVKARDKAPDLGDGWPEFRCTAEELAEHFTDRDQNIGILLGAPSGGLTDVDLDHAMARSLAAKFLPATNARFGRAGAETAHWLYYSVDAETQAFSNPLKKEGEKAHLVEIRSTGAQTVFPNSMHRDSGERIEWAEDGQPARVDSAALRTAVGLLATAALLALAWNGGNSRDEIAACAAGILRRLGKTDKEIGEFLSIVANAAGDEEAETRARKGRTSKRREYGWPKLRELIGDAAADRIGEWLGLDDDSLIDELNREFAVVPVGGKVVILREVEDRQYPGTRTVEYWRQQDFNLAFANRTVRAGEDRVPLARAWIASPKRREFKGVVFEPGMAETEGHFNLWTPWPIAPQQGSWERLKAHIYDNVANGNQRQGDWLVAFMAHAVQKPAEPPGVSLVLHGGQGVGKGIVYNSFGALFGRHYISVHDPRHIVGNFNSHLADKLLIFVDEGFFAGDRRHAAVLKAMITEPRVIIEPKGVNAFSIPNYRRVVFASNEDWVVPAGLDERRFAVYHVNPRKSQNRGYFGRIVAELEAGGYAAMMYDLLHFDLSKVNVARIPKTAALFDQKRATFDAATNFWFERLVDADTLPNTPGWVVSVRVSTMVEEFAKTLSGPYERRGVSTKLGMALRRLCPSVETDRPKVSGTRERQYVFPSLEECRREFERAVGYAINWETGNAKEEV
jgi:hypothetical protein